jgi:phosphoglycolate phosphatase-like HAD superfamily hydrolase
MSSSSPHNKILALDFDGVICNGLREYFEIARRAYLQIWQQDLVSNPETTPETWRQDFYTLRPVVETGWEMPLVLRALQLGFTAVNILDNWNAIAHKIIATEHLQSPEIAQTVDGLRDKWIAHAVDDWLSYHEFYPGVAAQIQQAQALEIEVLIISTKEGRFIQELLTRSGIDLPRSAIFGKETKCPKSEILQELLNTNPQLETLWFVEDRLKTLEQVASLPELKEVKLFLADWGYNTQPMRNSVIDHRRIQLISLTEFSVVGKHFQG